MYVGGGTPTVLPPAALEDLLSLLADSWAGTGSGTEWTIECNPDDLDLPMLDSFTAFGVTRLSVGVQSLEDPVRQAVRRRGKATEIMASLVLLSKHWRHQWSADFMYGMPLQTPGGLAQDIRKTIELGAGHVSLYELTLEDGTALHHEVRQGNLSLPDPDLSADQYAAAAEVLRSAGYQRYEVSNWALPGQSCLHNLHYWRMDDWDALGPAAVSNHRDGLSFIRSQNSLDDYVYAADPLGSVDFSVVSGIDAMFEFLMMALRTREGFPMQRFHDIFGHDPATVFGDLPSAFPGLLAREGGYWRPNDNGLDLLNRILVAALEATDLYGDAADAGDPVLGLSDDFLSVHVKDPGAGGLPL
jgi:oxygen-independent coproporphyrinogen-3 oxidase